MSVYIIEKMLRILLFMILIVGMCGCVDSRSARLKERQDTRLNMQVWDCGVNGGNVTATLIGDGTLILRGIGAMENYDGYGMRVAPWHGVKDYIIDVVIEDGVTTIGEAAFMKSVNLTNVRIPSTMTSIGSIAFAGCINLTTVLISDSAVFIERGTFPSRTSLTPAMTEDDEAFIGSQAFHGCTNLTSVTIPDGVQYIAAGAFWGCTSLALVTIPERVAYIGQEAFSACTSMMSVAIPRSVQVIDERAFVDCIGLVSITVAADNVRYCSEDGVLFNKAKDTLILCPKRKRGAYTIPGSTTFIEQDAFDGCTNLISVMIPSSVRSIGFGVLAFSRCTDLTSIAVVADNAHYSSNDGVLFNKAKDVLIRYPIGRQGAYTIPSSVRVIETGAFWDCTHLTSISCLNLVPPKVGLAMLFANAENLADDGIGIYRDACLNVPDSALSAYRDAEGWRDFKCIKPLATALDDG